MLYLTYARGFKSGGYNYAASVGSGLPLDPEVLDMVELGWKTTHADGRLQVSGSLFYYDYKDLQVTRAVAGSGVNVTENAADARALGLDLEVAWMPADWLSHHSRVEPAGQRVPGLRRIGDGGSTRRSTVIRMSRA